MFDPEDHAFSMVERGHVELDVPGHSWQLE